MRTVGTATEVLPPGSDRTTEWYEARRHGITASEIAAVLGLSRWQSPLALYYRKRDELGDQPDTPRLALGRYLEQYVLDCFADATGYELDPCGLVAAGDRPWQMATPDAVIGHIPVEAKSVLSDEDWGPTGSDQIPAYYLSQLLWQCDVLGADHGYLCAVFLRTGEPRWYRIGWDSDDVGVMRDAGLAFLTAVQDGTPPDPDASQATTDALRGRFPPDPEVPDAVCGRLLRAQYAAALRARKEADDNHKLVTNRIRQVMGASTRLTDPDGAIVATRRGVKDALYPARGLVSDGI